MVGFRGIKAKINIHAELLESNPFAPPPRNHVITNGFDFQSVAGSTVQVNGKNIVVPDFQVSKFEVTVSLFRQFINMTKFQPMENCKDHNDNLDRSWDYPEYDLNGDAPVTCINSRDAQQFIAWFNQENNMTVRLPTLSEWMVFAQEEISTQGDCSKDNLLDKNAAGKLNIQKSYERTDPFIEPTAAN